MADPVVPAAPAPVIAQTVNGMVVDIPPPTPIISAKTEPVPSAEVKPTEKPKLIPLKDFDYRAHLRSLLPGPADVAKPAEAKSADTAAPAPAAAEAKPETPAADSDDDKITRRLDALAARERAANEIEKRVAADLDRLKPFEDVRGSFVKDPIGTLQKAGVSPDEIARIVVKAIEDLGAGEATPPAEKPPEPAAPEPTPEQVAAAKAEYAAKAAPVAAKRAAELAADADLVRAAAAEGARLSGQDVYAFIVGECDRRFETGRAAKKFGDVLSAEQATALLDEVTRDVNNELAKSAPELVAKVRKPAPAAKPEKGEIAAVTTKMGGTVPETRTFKSEAEWREYHAQRIASLPRAKPVGRYTP
jgi:hypothetical protein